MHNPQYEFITSLSRLIADNGGTAYVVGGFVRDMVLYRLNPEEMRPHEIDIEVFGIGGEKLHRLLETFGVVNTVGVSFVVYKLRVEGTEVDVSLPRRESKSGKGHKGFVIEGDPYMSMAEASSRRDFRMNSIYYDPLKKELIDSHGGLGDIKNKIIRHINGSFRDDPLRVLRAARFSARLGFGVAPETMELCRTLDISELSRERIRNEFYKIFSYDNPHLGMYTASSIGAFGKLFHLNELDNKELSYFEPFYRLAYMLKHQSGERRIAVMLAMTALESSDPDKTIGIILSALHIHTLNNTDIRKIASALVKAYNLSNVIRKAHFADPMAHSYSEIKMGVLYRISHFADIELLELLLAATGQVDNYAAFFAHYKANRDKLNVHPILNGNDLIGIIDQRKIGEALHLAYEKQLDEDSSIAKGKLLEYVKFLYENK